MSNLPPVLEIADVELENQRVFLRTDLDAPVSSNGTVVDDFRIQTATKTIRALADAGAKVIVGSRFGEFRGGLGSQPEGPKAPSIEPVAARLSELLGMDVLLPDSCLGDAVKKVLTTLRDGQICVLENLCQQSDLGEAKEAFARQLLPLVDTYVGDSLRALSQPSATVTILPRLMETRAVGLNLGQEITAARRIQTSPEESRLLIWGGTSLSGRLPLLSSLTRPTTRVFLVGVAAQTMHRALGGHVGRSRVEEDYLAGARTLHEKLGDRLLLPSDVIAAENSRKSEGRVCPADDIAGSLMALDLGPESRNALDTEIQRADLVLWCGTAGLSKEEPFSLGTRSLLESLERAEGFTAIVGDDTVSAARGLNPDITSAVNYVASGGDATLELLNATKLPGLLALRGNLS